MSVPLLKNEGCPTCPIRNRAVCSRCDAGERDELDSVKFYRTVAAGDTIVLAGQTTDFVASVVTGVATQEQTMPDGRVQMVGLLLPADFIGRPGRSEASYDVVATTEMVLCCFRRRPFEQLIQQMPHIGQRLLEMTLDELDAAREWMLLLGRKTAREKIASLLTMIARRMAALDARRFTGQVTFDLPLTREAIANYLGLTIETVSRQFTNLRKDGLIVLEGKRRVHIPDLDALILETGDDTDGGMLA
ncbi:Crp/Fnr family transcriptional regulator [Rhodobacteraceae bacterium CCMM004]|nr:Crp/Fnr family transcriptional regulator [Rhodobacteraceae bacterium CCMM004]